MSAARDGLGNRIVNFIVEREKLLALVPNAEDLACRHIRVRPAMVSLLTGTFDLVTQLGADLDLLAREAVSRHLVDLVALVLGARGDAAELARGRGLAAAQLMVMKRYVLGQLSEPTLSVREVAVGTAFLCVMSNSSSNALAQHSPSS